MDRIGLSEPSLVMHSFRHGFRNACRRAGLDREIADGLGGWTTPGVGASYGSVNDVVRLPDNLALLSKVQPGDGFKLAAAKVREAA
jgi:hypothetical protein